MTVQVVLTGGKTLTVEGPCIASVVALDHDDSIRRCFRLYRCATGYVAERIDHPDSIDVRFWGSQCNTTMDVYDFFGNEPLANYLYGRLQLPVPGLRSLI